MAKLKGPMFSLEARGKAGSLVFEKTGNTNYVKSNKWSKKPPTDKQKNKQEIYGKGVQLWRLMSTEKKDEWKEFARSKPGSGFNYFMQYVLTAIEIGIYGVHPYNACAYGD